MEGGGLKGDVEWEEEVMEECAEEGKLHMEWGYQPSEQVPGLAGDEDSQNWLCVYNNVWSHLRSQR